jgi:hypothetical protein
MAENPDIMEDDVDEVGGQDISTQIGRTIVVILLFAGYVLSCSCDVALVG